MLSLCRSFLLNGTLQPLLCLLHLSLASFTFTVFAPHSTLPSFHQYLANPTFITPPSSQWFFTTLNYFSQVLFPSCLQLIHMWDGNDPSPYNPLHYSYSHLSLMYYPSLALVSSLPLYITMNLLLSLYFILSYPTKNHHITPPILLAVKRACWLGK